METFISTQSLTIGGLVVLLVVALAARYFVQRKQQHDQHQSYVVDHRQAMADLGNRARTRAAAERKERALIGANSTYLGHY